MKREGKGGKSVSYTIDANSNQPSDEFRQIMSKIKDGHKNWKTYIESCLDNLDNAKRQAYIRSYFIPKLENPGVKLTGVIKTGDGRVASENDYRKFGQAMGFYSAKCVRKMTETDTEIDEDKFKEIMQGCFGAAPNAKHEDDNFLTQFMTLEPKMKIDAAKNVINSIHMAGTKDIESKEVHESYYSGLSYVMNLLFESEEDSNNNSDIECPKSIEDFNNNDVGIALKQAQAVAAKYPKQYKIWYEKLRAAFDEGVADYQKKERNKDLMENGIENPITGEIEKRNGKAWGAGGPNAFIRNNPKLKALTDKIKQGSPGCEGVNGWDIFNCGPKLILCMFDALEKGGEIFQKLCDDLNEGMKDLKRSFGNMKPGDFDKLIKKYASKKKHGDAMTIAMASVMCSLTNMYKILANGKIGKINTETKTFNSVNVNNDNVIQIRVDDLKNSISQLIQEKADYDKWKEVEDKKILGRQESL